MTLLRELTANAGHLLVGKIAAAIFGLLSTMLAARTLGVEQFGVLAVVVAYAGLMDKVFGFQPWQSVIRYGSALLGVGDGSTLRSLVKLGFILDGLGAIVAAGAAVGCAYLAGRLLNWDREAIDLAFLYGLTLATNLTGTPLGVLRIHNKFKLLMCQSILSSGIKFLGVVVIATKGGGFAAFVFVWALSDILGRFMLIAMSVAVLRRQGHDRWFAADVTEVLGRFKDFWPFTWSAKLQMTVRAGTTDIDTLIVGGILGPAAAGLFAVVKKVGAMVMTLSDPLYQAIYPMLARLWNAANYKKFSDLMRQTMIGTGIAAVVTWLGFLGLGHEIIELTLGRPYVEVYVPMAIYLLGSLIAVVTFSAYPALLSAGEASTGFVILLVATAAYMVLLSVLAVAFGLRGAAVAFVAFYVIWASLIFMKLKSVIESANKLEFENSMDEKGQ